jgi:hypothetical protein
MRLLLGLLLASFLAPASNYDLVVVGGTASGVGASIMAAREGLQVALVEKTQRLGGMIVNGVSKTDIGMRETSSGLFEEFRQRVKALYRDIPECEDGFKYEPKVALEAIRAMVEAEPRITGGWQIQAVYEAQSGAPLGFGNAILYGTLDQIGLSNGEKTIDRWFNTDVFERLTTLQLSNNQRTMSPQFSSIRSHGVNIWNASAMKIFSIREGIRLQFRSEFINALNHTHFSAPNTTPTSSLFGVVSSSAGKPREIYFALKLLF